jgi:hypothetical protein
MRTKVLKEVRRTRSKKSILLVFVLACLLPGCGTKQESVQVKVPQDVKTAIEKAAPPKDYGFYSLKTSPIPQSAQDLRDWSLLACAADDFELDIEITSSSLSSTKALLFKSSKSYFIADNMSGPNPDSPVASTSGGALEGPGFGKVDLAREGLIFGKGMTPKKLLEKCILALQADPKSLLVTKRSLAGAKKSALREIKFD